MSDFVYTKINLHKETIILADGLLPQNPKVLALLYNATSIVCCDGACAKLLSIGLEPTAIVGDLDSLSNFYKTKYADKTVFIADQDSNDLSKAVNFCIENKCEKIKILGATGLREDHTIANISLIAHYAQFIQVEMITDTGYFTPVLHSKRLISTTGQQISIFSLQANSCLQVRNLKYPIDGVCLNFLWSGTLNEALGDWFELIFENGIYIVYQLHY